MTLGARELRDWMARRGYNQIETATALGLAESLFSMFINGKRVPGRENAVKIEELTGIPVKAWSLRRRDKSTDQSAADLANASVSNK